MITTFASIFFLLILVVVLVLFTLVSATVVISIVSRILGFIFGGIGDIAGILAGAITAVAMVPLVLISVMLGRWDKVDHYAIGLRRGGRRVGQAVYSLCVRRPLRLLFLDGVRPGIVHEVPGVPGEDPAVLPGGEKAVRRKPVRGGMSFPGYEIVGTLPPGGSGARLYIASPDERTRGSLAGAPSKVVIKSFDLVDGSSLPQIVRESRSLDAARSLGLVLDHRLDERSFWYAMPYHAGDHLGEVVRRAHHDGGDQDGLRGAALRDVLGFEIDLLETLDRYHGQGLWHKDVKPENIIVHDGVAHLVDFGLVTSLRSAMTLTTHGTEYFRDPEMVRMAMQGVKVHEVDGGRFDVYGAGAVLYYMLENTFPGHGGLSRFGRPSPEALRWIVRRAMADYDRRYATAAEMLGDLRFVAAQPDPWAVTPASLPSVAGGVGGQFEDAIVDPVASASSRTPRPGVRMAVATRSRPRLSVVNWWTGAYREDAGRGVSSAPQSVISSAPAQETGGPGIASIGAGLFLLMVLASAVVAFFSSQAWRYGFESHASVELPAMGLTWSWDADAWRPEDGWAGAGDGVAVPAPPPPGDLRGVVLLSDHGDRTPSDVQQFLDRVEESVVRVGWVPAGDLPGLDDVQLKIDAAVLAMLQMDGGGREGGAMTQRMIDQLEERGIGALVVVDEDGTLDLSAELISVDGATLFEWGQPARSD